VHDIVGGFFYKPVSGRASQLVLTWLLPVYNWL